jgi:hypothetical protein
MLKPVTKESTMIKIYPSPYLNVFGETREEEYARLNEAAKKRQKILDTSTGTPKEYPVWTEEEWKELDIW